MYQFKTLSKNFPHVDIMDRNLLSFKPQKQKQKKNKDSEVMSYDVFDRDNKEL